MSSGKSACRGFKTHICSGLWLTASKLFSFKKRCGKKEIWAQKSEPPHSELNPLMEFSATELPAGTAEGWLLLPPPLVAWLLWHCQKKIFTRRCPSAPKHWYLPVPCIPAKNLQGKILLFSIYQWYLFFK